jgi:uncharacterized sulfatase
VLFLIFLFSCNARNRASKENGGLNHETFKIDKLPNFIFYLADDQDQLDYGCYGNPKIMTPNVDLLAKEGMRFTNFYTAQAICAPARSQIFTGMYPIKNGCMANHLPVKNNITSVAALLKDEGYEVVLAGKSHVSPDNVFNWTAYLPSADHRNLPIDSIDIYLKNAKKPFCLFITSDYPHEPYPETSNYTADDIYQLPYDKGNIPAYKPGYYKNVAKDNVQLGEILDIVDSYNLRDNSIFIYASDHGISGKWGVSEQGMKVPFIVRWPGVVKPNSVSNTLLSFIDVLPTFLDITKSNIPEDIDGKSFLKTLKGNKEEVHDYIYGIATKQNIQKCKIFPSRMVRDQKFKFIRNYNALEVYKSNLGENPYVNSFIKIGAESFPDIPYEELYDLSVDPYQTKNLINNSNYRNKREILINALESWMVEQNDFLVSHKMPLLKPTKHPLDRESEWNKVPNELKLTLKNKDYVNLHY